MKRILMTGTLVLTLVILTGCGDKKTLTCTKSSSDNGFTNDIEAVYEFDGNKIKKSVQTNSIVAEGAVADYIDEYKNSAQELVDEYNNKKGFTAKVESDNSKISVIVEMDPSKMDESEFNANRMGENYDSMKAVLTQEQGYTCK